MLFHLTTTVRPECLQCLQLPKTWWLNWGFLPVSPGAVLEMFMFGTAFHILRCQRSGFVEAPTYRADPAIQGARCTWRVHKAAAVFLECTLYPCPESQKTPLSTGILSLDFSTRTSKRDTNTGKDPSLSYTYPSCYLGVSKNQSLIWTQNL